MLSNSMVFLPLSEIKKNGKLQPRVEMNSVVVEDYKERLLEDVEFDFPPVVVFRVMNGNKLLADGYHRFEAYMAAGRNKMPVELKEGSFSDALGYSVGANAEHGLRRTSEDIRRSVLLALESKRYSSWSDNKIARLCNVSQPTVGRVRKTLVKDASKKPIREVTYEKNGKPVKMKVGNIGKGREKQKEEQEPETSFHILLHDMLDRQWKELRALGEERCKRRSDAPKVIWSQALIGCQKPEWVLKEGVQPLLEELQTMAEML